MKQEHFNTEHVIFSSFSTSSYFVYVLWISLWNDNKPKTCMKSET